MTRTRFPIFVFAILVLAAGAVHGLHSDRWKTSTALEDAVRRLDAVPLTVGNWRGEMRPLDADELKAGGIKGHASCQFRNVVTGETITLLVVCGRSGPISVHTPDVCYGGAGFQAVSDQYRKDVPLDPGRSQSVWAMRFRTPATVASSQIEVSWVWFGGDTWAAPDNARWGLARYPVLYKLYVVRDWADTAAKQRKDPTVSFLQSFLPEFEKVLTLKPSV